MDGFEEASAVAECKGAGGGVVVDGAGSTFEVLQKVREDGDNEHAEHGALDLTADWRRVLRACREKDML